MMESNGEKLFDEYRKIFIEKLNANSNYAEEASEQVYNRIMEDLLFEVMSEVHRAHKLGYADTIHSRFKESKADAEESLFEYSEMSLYINCPKCNKQLDASKFTTHLQFCIQGRSSLRIASQKVSSTKDNSYGGVSDDDDDVKLTSERGKGMKKSDGKRKRDSNRKKPYKIESPKTIRETPGSSGYKSYNTKALKENQSKLSKDNSENDSWFPTNKANLNEDNLHIFAGKCGVKSDLTGKYCGRTLRCHSHTDAEREIARKLLSPGISVESAVDIEAVDHSKNVIRNFSNLGLSTPVSKKKEKQRQSYSKF